MGGFAGKLSVNTILQRKTPSSYGVPTKLIVRTDLLVTWTDDVGLDVKNIAIRVLMEQNACRRVVDQFVLLFGKHVDDTWVNLYLLQKNF